MDCRSCGSANPEGKRFCGDCGAPLSLRCLACGADNPPDKRFCGDCGVALAEAGLPAAAAKAVSPGTISNEIDGQAERRQLTVMFCDVVGSTALSVRLDPEDLREIIGAYQRCVADTVARFDGYVARYMGDGVLVYFGYPRAHEDDAERAVRAGLALVEAVAEFEGQEQLQVRIGIATGLVVVGDLVGVGDAQERTAVGETLNLAARLQAAAEANSVVVASMTRQLIGELFECREADPISAKGFAEPVPLWQVLRASAVASRFEAFHPGNSLSLLVGREEEVELSLRRWQRAKEGQGRVIVFSGEPGIGKSRITRAIQEQLRSERHIRLLYFCSPYHQASALYPFVSQIHRAAGFGRDDPVEQKLDKLETLLALSSKNIERDAATLADLLSIPASGRYPPLDLSPSQRKAQTFAVLLAQLEGIVAKQPVLIVFEDAHWIDPTSLELLEEIVERAQSMPILVIVTARPEFAPPWAGRSHVSIQLLNRLGPREGRAIVDRVAGGRSLSHEVLDQIIERTDGVPLFIEELTKTVLDSGLLEDAGGRFDLSSTSPPLAIPATLYGSLMARLDRLGAVKEVAQIGAVIGREFTYELIAAIEPLHARQLQDALAQLVASELIFCRGTPPDATYSFKHALVQDAAYQSLLKADRQQYHQRIAQILEKRFHRMAETEPEILAHHYTAAGVVRDAVRCWHLAGQLAVQRSANIEAVSHCERALELVLQIPEGPTRSRQELEIQMTVGPALVAARGFADRAVGRAYARAWALCQELGDDTRLPIAIRGRQVFHRIRGELLKAHEFAEQLFVFAEAHDDSALKVGSCQALGQDLFQLGELKAARRIFEQGIALFDPKQHRLRDWPGGQPGEQCYLYGAFVLWMLGFPDLALRRSNEALSLAEDFSNPANLINTLAFASLVHVFRREPSSALKRAEATMEMSIAQRNPYFLAWGKILHGWAMAAQSDGSEGIAEMAEGLAGYRDTGSETWLPYFLGLQAETCLSANRPDDGLVLVTDALALVEKTSERAWLAELHRLKGELLFVSAPDDLAVPEMCFSRALEIAREQEAKSWEIRANMSLCCLNSHQSRQTQGCRQLRSSYEWFSEGLDTPDLRRARVLIDNMEDT